MVWGTVCPPLLPAKYLICYALTVMGHDLSFEEPDSAFGFGGEQLIHRLPDDGYAWGLDPIQMK